MSAEDTRDTNKALDRWTARFLRVIQQDGRISNLKLAETVAFVTNCRARARQAALTREATSWAAGPLNPQAGASMLVSSRWCWTAPRPT